ncbi:MAG: Trm112 family protein [Candidatus Omnitrophica bacterium]|nr:Trm112 family protein [Candidatus Omnitrophota bacterium]
MDKELLEILACPICKRSIVEEGNELICRACKKAYPVRDGIPIMLIDEARDLEKTNNK